MKIFNTILLVLIICLISNVQAEKKHGKPRDTNDDYPLPQQIFDNQGIDENQYPEINFDDLFQQLQNQNGQSNEMTQEFFNQMMKNQQKGKPPKDMFENFKNQILENNEIPQDQQEMLDQYMQNGELNLQDLINELKNQNQHKKKEFDIEGFTQDMQELLEGTLEQFEDDIEDVIEVEVDLLEEFEDIVEDRQNNSFEDYSYSDYESDSEDSYKGSYSESYSESSSNSYSESYDYSDYSDYSEDYESEDYFGDN